MWWWGDAIKKLGIPYLGVQTPRQELGAKFLIDTAKYENKIKTIKIVNLMNICINLK